MYVESVLIFMYVGAVLVRVVGKERRLTRFCLSLCGVFVCLMKVILSIVVVVVDDAVAVTANEDDGHNYFLIMMYVILMCVEHLCVDVARGALGIAWYSGLHST